MSYHLSETSTFIMEHYDKQKPFTSFLTGIAGLKGIPLWSFYVNRGQGICSFGVEDKNSPIMEFFPANQSYQYVGIHGFRTFIQIDDQDVYEAFSTYSHSNQIKRTMSINSSAFTLEEINLDQGLKVTVTYFGLPNESVGALVRKVTVQNLGLARNIKILDGIADIIPYGIKNGEYKEMGNLLKSWMEVINLENMLPFYKVRATTEDTVEIDVVTKGHFYLSFVKDHELIMPIVDKQLVFGYNTGLTYPDAFGAIDFSAKAYSQYTSNKVPCGFTPYETALETSQTVTLHTLIGHSASVDLVESMLDRVLTADYINSKEVEAGRIIDEMLASIETKTALPLFDAYLKQSYLDNLLRGGYPITLNGHDKSFIYYVYSRKHGDPEREYNFFRFAPEFYSNGEGNFRDVNQNRRCDVLFKPEVGTHNIKLFMNLIQLDGYNPLVVENSHFVLTESTHVEELVNQHISSHQQLLVKALKNSFTPGELAAVLYENSIVYKTSEEHFIKEVLDHSEQKEGARHGEGFWSDHFTYNLDLVESYLKVFPDRLEELLIGDSSYLFYNSPETVMPRAEKYQLTPSGVVRQYGSVVEDEEKVHQLKMNPNGTNWVKTAYGKGDYYETNLMTKLLALMVSKFASLDPSGMGVEMEAGKPGWNDALNGLSGLIGSGIAETLETLRINQFLLASFEVIELERILIPEELAELIIKLRNLLEDKEFSDFEYWDKSAGAKEAFREKTRFGLSGNEEPMEMTWLVTFLELTENKFRIGLEKAKAMGDGLYPSFISHEATDFEPIVIDGVPQKTAYGMDAVRVKGFTPRTLPMFLEGPARYLKTKPNHEAAIEVYEKVMASGIYDEKLKMYKTSESLEGEGHEIGRIRAFTAGWLERESVFLHMTYKYLLGLLEAGLYYEYFDALDTNFVPFMNPEVYGRSILENSSFIASSVNPDPQVHGQGFVSRLSGSNAEVLHLWYGMMIGNGGFSHVDGLLSFGFDPVLQSRFFGEAGRVTFNFLSHTPITYINKTGKDTFGENKAKAVAIEVTIDGQLQKIEGNNMSQDMALKLRKGEIEAVTVYFE